MTSLPATRETTPRSTAFGVVSIMSLFLAIALGLLAASLFLPDGGVQLANTLTGTSPKAYWYLSRGSAFVALGLLWLSMIFGLLITDKMARSWPGAPTAFGLHEYVSLLGLAFGLFHALILLGDRYINYTLAQVLMPFGSVNYHPVWVGIGQIGLYAWAIISVSFYVRQWIGSKAWKFIHYLSFANFIIVMLHGLGAGTDATAPWAQAVYWVLGGSVVFFTAFRIVAGLLQPKLPVRAAPNPVPQQQQR